MKLILLTVIKLYWKFIPERRRRTCLFKESCSNYVFRHTNEHGFFKGLSALMVRYKKCRHGYEIYTGQNGFEMKLVDGTIILEGEISLNIMDPIYKQIDAYSNTVKINEG